MRALVLAGLALLATTAHAQLQIPQLDGLTVDAARAAPPAPYTSGLDVPPVDADRAIRLANAQTLDVLEASGSIVMRADELAEFGLTPAEMQDEMTAGVDALLVPLGLASGDFAAAVGFAYVALAATAQNVPLGPEAGETARAVAASVAGWADRYRALSPDDQADAYILLVFGSEALYGAASTHLEPEAYADLPPEFRQQMEASWAEGLDDLVAETQPARDFAAVSFRSLFGGDPFAVELGTSAPRQLDGAVPLVAQRTGDARAGDGRGGDRRAGDPAATGAADGVEIYISYGYAWRPSLGATGFGQDLLILFPDGTAVNEWPLEPVSAFTADAVRRAFTDPDDREWSVGTWRRDGERLTVSIGDETETLARTSRGWRNVDDGPDESDSGLDTYFRAVPLSEDDLLGPWRSESYMTTGMNSTTQVSSSDITDRVFFGDGRYADVVEGSFLATSGYTAYDPSVRLAGMSSGSGTGTWRLDGMQMTLEWDGGRTVVPAFALPEWRDDAGRPIFDIWIADAIWERPGDE